MPDTDALSLDQARQVLAAQPFAEHVGTRITEFGDGGATLEVDIADQHRQQYGLVHGGVLAYLADNALTFAAGTVLGASVLTASVSVDYLKAARDGLLRARATVVHHNRRIAVCTAEIHAVTRDADATLCAIARGTVLTTQR